MTPIARLIEDQEALIVPKDSPFKTVDDLLAAWKNDPDSVANWRGILAPPGISDKARADLTTLFTKMHETQAWKDAVKRNGWIDSFATGDEFAAFLTAQDKRVETTLKELGLT